MSTKTRGSRNCEGVHRRDAIRIGSLGALGLNLGDWLNLRAASPANSGSAKSCILLWLDGGPSHLETFDPKPEAPAEVRGPFGTIRTAVPGIQLSEHLPRTAEQMSRVAIVRSLTSPVGEHGLANHYLLTGYRPSPVLEYPSIGSVAAHFRSETNALPPYVAVPDRSAAAGPGFLGEVDAPFVTGGDPGKPDFQVRDLDFYPGVDGSRIERRSGFRARLDAFHRRIDASAPSSSPRFEQAHRLITSPEAKGAFDFAAEGEAVRARYGPRTFGQSCLLARRLVERGVPFVTVHYPGWDSHENLVTRLYEGYTGAQVGVGLIPTFDQAFAALVEDLAERGLLGETLVVAMGEFGRTPKLNTAGGRDHWPRAFSVALAGGGVVGGQVVGASDRAGESPADRPVTPADLARTIYTMLGVDPDAELHTPDGRPVRVNQGGDVVRELIS